MPTSITLSLAVAVLAGMAQAQVVVTSTNDSGPGSLRDAITFAASGSTINFATNLSGQTIFLTSGQLLVTNNLTVDASALPGGLAINGNQTSRLFYIQTNATVVLNSLTLTNGYVVGTNGLNSTNSSAGGAGSDGLGGGIYNAGILTLNQCIVTGNTVIGGSGGNGSVGQSGTGYGGTGGDALGGGAYNYYTGTINLNQCAVSGNLVIGGHGGNGANGARACT